jgi:AbrB family looped-hinge helix DNA binding protein
MVTATLTSKGQITIPKSVRDSLHLRTGDRVSFVVQDNIRATLEPVTKSVDDVYGKLHRPGQACRSVEEMNAAVAERMRKRAK